MEFWSLELRAHREHILEAHEKSSLAVAMAAFLTMVWTIFSVSRRITGHMTAWMTGRTRCVDNFYAVELIS